MRMHIQLEDLKRGAKLLSDFRTVIPVQELMILKHTVNLAVKS